MPLSVIWHASSSRASIRSALPSVMYVLPLCHFWLFCSEVGGILLVIWIHRACIAAGRNSVLVPKTLIHNWLLKISYKDSFLLTGKNCCISLRVNRDPWKPYCTNRTYVCETCSLNGDWMQLKCGRTAGESVEQRHQCLKKDQRRKPQCLAVYSHFTVWRWQTNKTEMTLDWQRRRLDGSSEDVDGRQQLTGAIVHSEDAVHQLNSEEWLI